MHYVNQERNNKILITDYVGVNVCFFFFCELFCSYIYIYISLVTITNLNEMVLHSQNRNVPY